MILLFLSVPVVNYGAVNYNDTELLMSRWSLNVIIKIMIVFISNKSAIYRFYSIYKVKISDK